MVSNCRKNIDLISAGLTESAEKTIYNVFAARAKELQKVPVVDTVDSVPPPLKPRPKPISSVEKHVDIEIVSPTSTHSLSAESETDNKEQSHSIADDLNKALATGPKPYPRSASHKEASNATDETAYSISNEFIHDDNLQPSEKMQHLHEKSSSEKLSTRSSNTGPPVLAPRPKATPETSPQVSSVSSTPSTLKAEVTPSSGHAISSIPPALAPKPKKAAAVEESKKEEKRSLLSSLTKARPRKPGNKQTNLNDSKDIKSNEDMSEENRLSVVSDGDSPPVPPRDLSEENHSESRQIIGDDRQRASVAGKDEEHIRVAPAVRRRPKPEGENQRPKTMVESESALPISVGERPFSMHAVEHSMEDDENIAEEEAKPKPRKTYGVFATNHGALGALAAAVTGRSGPPIPIRETNTEVVPEDENEEHKELEEKDDIETLVTDVEPSRKTEIIESPGRHSNTEVSPARARPPVRVGFQQPDLFHAPPLQIKRKEFSVSGDDKAIEKMALDWINHNLEDRDIIIKDIYTSLNDGLNLIYALEKCTGESVGKYNKRVILPVHKIDNLSVALRFLDKKGISTAFVNPQELMDGNKSKILTLFTYICRTYPLERPTPLSAEPSPIE